MKKNRLYSVSIMSVLAMALLSGRARANTIDINLTQTVESGATGTIVMFDATLTNASTSTIFLNGSGGTTVSPFLTIDGSPFLLNAPLSLAPGASSGQFNIFDVMIAPGTPLALYGPNTFTILGGLFSNSFNVVGSTNFSVNVNAVPEPASIWLLVGSSLMALLLLSVQIGSRSGSRYAISFRWLR